jgi:DNA repair exonuclease SbcCD ATPase subunit
MGRWVSSSEAARHLGVSDSAIRKRGANGQIERRERDAGGPGKGWEYYLEDDQVDDTVAIEAAVGESGVEMLAEAIEKIHQTSDIQRDAIAAVTRAYEGQIEAERSHSRELRERIDELQAENQALREEMRDYREQERKRNEALEAYVRELRERSQKRDTASWWRFWQR